MRGQAYSPTAVEAYEWQTANTDNIVNSMPPLKIHKLTNNCNSYSWPSLKTSSGENLDHIFTSPTATSAFVSNLRVIARHPIFTSNKKYANLFSLFRRNFAQLLLFHTWSRHWNLNIIRLQKEHNVGTWLFEFERWPSLRHLMTVTIFGEYIRFLWHAGYASSLQIHNPAISFN